MTWPRIGIILLDSQFAPTIAPISGNHAFVASTSVRAYNFPPGVLSKKPSSPSAIPIMGLSVFHAESPIIGIAEGEDGFLLNTPGGKLQARTLVLATNAWLP